MKFATCHPDRRSYAKGLCSACSLLSRPGAREARRAYRKAHYVANRERYIREAARWAKENPEAKRAAKQAYYSRNKAKSVLYKHARRAYVAVASTHCTTPTEASIRALLAKPCAYCQASPSESIDHIVPISRGGLHTLTNLVGACMHCNLSKGNRLLYSEWVPPVSERWLYAVRWEEKAA